MIMVMDIVVWRMIKSMIILENEHQVSFASYQLFVFVACYFGYGLMLFNRKSFTFALPHVIMEEYFSSYEIGE